MCPPHPPLLHVIPYHSCPPPAHTAHLPPSGSLSGSLPEGGFSAGPTGGSGGSAATAEGGEGGASTKGGVLNASPAPSSSLPPPSVDWGLDDLGFGSFRQPASNPVSGGGSSAPR